MTIAMVNTFHYRRGGDATCALETTAALRARGHRVVSFAMEHPENEPSAWADRFAARVDWRGGRRAALRGLVRGAWNRDAARRCTVIIAACQRTTSIRTQGCPSPHEHV